VSRAEASQRKCHLARVAATCSPDGASVAAVRAPRRGEGARGPAVLRHAGTSLHSPSPSSHTVYALSKQSAAGRTQWWTSKSGGGAMGRRTRRAPSTQPHHSRNRIRRTRGRCYVCMCVFVRGLAGSTSGHGCALGGRATASRQPGMCPGCVALLHHPYRSVPSWFIVCLCRRVAQPQPGGPTVPAAAGWPGDRCAR